MLFVKVSELIRGYVINYNIKYFYKILSSFLENHNANISLFLIWYINNYFTVLEKSVKLLIKL